MNGPGGEGWRKARQELAFEDAKAWLPSLRAIGRSTSYEHYLELVEEEAGKLLVEEVEDALKEGNAD
jgi:hypothetical protein